MSDTIHEILQFTNQRRPTIDSISEACPQFRILVIGKPGVGKFSLLNRAFGILEASHTSLAGHGSIEREVLSSRRLILHTSQGFEHGELGLNATNVVQDFVRRRNKMVEIRHKLHAIWVCVEIPTECTRLMEHGLEEFLKEKVTGNLGQVPVIMIFTKYDKLVSAERLTLTKAGSARDSEPTIEKAEENANARLRRECISPLEAIVGKSFPRVAVSTHPQYRHTLTSLMRITFTSVQKYIAKAAIAMAISQNLRPELKLRIAAESGLTEYWPMVDFPDLEIIHINILKLWDFNDDDHAKYLSSSEFQWLLMRSVWQMEENLGPGDSPSSATYMAVLGNIIPSYRRFQLRRVMIYILNLMLVIQKAFWVQSIDSSRSRRSDTPEQTTNPIESNLVKTAWRLHSDSDHQDHLRQINDYTRKVNIFFRGGPSATINKCIELVGSYADEQEFRQEPHVQNLYWSYLDEARDLPSRSRTPDKPAPDKQTERTSTDLDPVQQRFRILMVGRTNSGKTTIMQKVCNTTEDPDAYTKYNKRLSTEDIEPLTQHAPHPIEHQLLFRNNPSFIFHDSQGLEANGLDKLEKVKSFVSERAGSRFLNSRIHVIWYCISLDDPHPIRRVHKRFFSSGTSGVPVVVVFTKCDLLEFSAIDILEEQGYDYDFAVDIAKMHAERTYKDPPIERLRSEKYPPKGHVFLGDMHKQGTQVQELLKCTAGILGDDSLRNMFASALKGGLDRPVEAD